MHHRRAGHCVAVSPSARVTCGDWIKLLYKMQAGSYLGEDDIVRFEDIYQRA